MNEKHWSFRSREEIKRNVDSLVMQKIYRLIDSKDDPRSVLDVMRGVRELHLEILTSIQYDIEDEERKKAEKEAQNENVPND